MILYFNISENNTGISALIYLFYTQEELARAEEKKTDAILDGNENSKQNQSLAAASKSHEEFIEETVAQCKNIHYLFILQFFLPNFARAFLIH